MPESHKNYLTEICILPNSLKIDEGAEIPASFSEKIVPENFEFTTKKYRGEEYILGTPFYMEFPHA